MQEGRERAHAQGGGRADSLGLRTCMCSAHAQQPKPAAGQAQKMGNARHLVNDPMSQTGMKHGVTSHMSVIKVRLSPCARVCLCMCVQGSSWAHTLQRHSSVLRRAQRGDVTK